MDKRPCTGAACLGMGLTRVRGTRTLALHGHRVPRRGFERALSLQQHEEVPHAQQHDHDEGEGVQDVGPAVGDAPSESGRAVGG